MTVVDDPYGFDGDIGDRLESIQRDQDRLRYLVLAIPFPTPGDGQGVDRQEVEEYITARKKAEQTAAYLELEKIIAGRR
jgi:hypothetical protein